jgi:hypothetical protein
LPKGVGEITLQVGGSLAPHNRVGQTVPSRSEHDLMPTDLYVDSGFKRVEPETHLDIVVES